MATYNFYMKSGNVVQAHDVENIEITKSNVVGEVWLRSYKIKWAKGKNPRFWNIDQDQVEAITCDEPPKTDWFSFLKRK